MILNIDVDYIVNEIKLGKRDLFDTIKEYMILAESVEEQVDIIRGEVETQYDNQVDDLETQVSDLEDTIEDQDEKIEKLEKEIEIKNEEIKQLESTVLYCQQNHGIETF